MQYEEQSLRYHAISNIGIDTCGYTYQDIKESIPLYDKFTILFSDVFIFPKQYKANLISILCAYVLKIQSARNCFKRATNIRFFCSFHSIEVETNSSTFCHGTLLCSFILSRSTSAYKVIWLDA